MCKYTCVLPALLLLMTLSGWPFHTKAGIQEAASPETAKQAASAGDQQNPRFEITSIKHNPKGNLSNFTFLPGGKLKVINLPLRNLISEGYGIPLFQVEGVPGFLKDIDWDIEATPEEGKYPLKNGLLDPEIGRLMVQSMLENRFKLKVHRETRILPGYELVIAKGGLKIKRSEEQSKSFVGAIMPGAINGKSMSLSSLTQVLTTMLKLWEGDEKRFYVVDKTGLEGLYNIHLRWTPDLSKAPGFPKEEADQSGITFIDAIQEQLGLKLVPANLPMPVVVVDEVQMPGTN